MNIFLEEDSTSDFVYTPELIVTLVMNGLIILISIYVLFLYIKSEQFHSYSCAYIVILSISILVDNILRVIPIGRQDHINALSYIQAFILTSLDKYILLALTMQVFIIYLGIMKTNFYYAHKKAIFYISFFSGLGLSFLIGGLFLLNGLTCYGLYNYVDDLGNKGTFDTIFNSVFLGLNTFFCIIIILNICIRKEEIEKEMLNENEYEHDLYRIIIIFIANSFIYIESFLIIYDKLPVPDNYIDLVYIITCLIINLIYTINKVVIKETKKIFCKKLFAEERIQSKTFVQTNTYEEKEMSYRISEEYDDN